MVESRSAAPETSSVRTAVELLGVLVGAREMIWLEHCIQQARSSDVSPSTLAILDAFGPGTHAAALDMPDSAVERIAPSLVRATSFLELDQDADVVASQLTVVVIRELRREIGSGRAATLARKFRDVVSILGKLSRTRTEARVLRIGLLGRLAGILAAPPPRSRRVLSITDFYLCQSALLADDAASPACPSLQHCVEEAEWKSVARGVDHATISTRTKQGPVHINLLRTRSADLVVCDCRDGFAGATFAQWVESKGAVAGVSGGYFLQSELDIEFPSRPSDPVGMLVSEGRVLNPPVFARSALVQYSDQRTLIAQVGMEGVQILWGAGQSLVEATNRWDAVGQVPVVFNRAGIDRLPRHPYDSIAVVRSEVIASGVGISKIPLAGFVLVLPSMATPAPDVGTRLVYRLPTSKGVSLANAVAGGPMLVGPAATASMGAPRHEDLVGTAPPVTLVGDETLDQNLLPRMAVGITKDGAVLFAAVDGRDIQRALGLTLGQTGRLMAMVGCVSATNLDGGSSKRMVVGGTTVDLGGEAALLRARSSVLNGPVPEVPSAILVYPGSCEF